MPYGEQSQTESDGEAHDKDDPVGRAAGLQTKLAHHGATAEAKVVHEQVLMMVKDGIRKERERNGG